MEVTHGFEGLPSVIQKCPQAERREIVATILKKKIVGAENTEIFYDRTQNEI